MDKQIFRLGFIFSLTIIETSCKNVKMDSDQILLFIGKQPDLTPSRIEKE